MILGKWQANNDKEVIFSFDQDDKLRTEINRPVKIYKRTLNFEILDKKTVVFYDVDSGKVTYKATLKGNNEFYLACEFETIINGVTRVDPPELCAYSFFQKN